ncbi:tricarballylate utilization 4Fe-4S protein TcuB [Plastoroseomonas arctica]|uniref:Tricarballylate utilization 4Fe-4S protein TcuB n=1 Tax=Plastoroseomonas arctica TaxID=1509237 RepID=A0AAF1K577_9PROT|nr:tricarballylate utilization 4Fe-4S protein TcuB [Plastoroseomonas arctica]MBR0656361.1 tricarballylate utilization 4Fe-4S protein TcuB [Plastoroseomonas arctica]
MQETETTTDARRQMEICNSCRYCEGYCAVFPAMAMRRDFTAGDLTHLANLCHGCKGCYHACQYAPPHQFGVNIPATFATLRLESYAEYAWPPAMGRVFARNGTLLSLAAALAIALVLIGVMAFGDPAILYTAQTGQGAFFRVIPMWLMTGIAGAAFLYAGFATAMGALRYWRATAGGPITVAPAIDAGVSILTLRNLGGGGHGCNDVDDGFTGQKRWLHHAMFYGFMLCFAATTSGAIFHHILGLRSPHAFFSLPVQLGFWGGLLLCIGTAGLIRLKIVTDPVPVAQQAVGGEYAMLSLLFLVGSTGLLLLAIRHTGAMGVMLAIHLGLVLALFLALPYSKMVHGVYRGLALLRNAREVRAVKAASA